MGEGVKTKKPIERVGGLPKKGGLESLQICGVGGGAWGRLGKKEGVVFFRGSRGDTPDAHYDVTNYYEIMSSLCLLLSIPFANKNQGTTEILRNVI